MIHGLDMAPLDKQLMQLDRPRLLQFLAALINHLTIYARANYDTEERSERLVEANEAIHRVSGHLRDLMGELEPMTEGRSASIVACASLLVPSELERLRIWSGV